MPGEPLLWFEGVYAETEAREIINSVTYAEAIEAKKRAAEEKAWIEKLKKYIKAENLKVVEKLTDKYDYFK